jgi:hypothetical protein
VAEFKPCQGQTACRDDGEGCLTCGRSLLEIAMLRNAIDQLAHVAQVFDYENSEDYADYISHKLKKVLKHRQSNQPNQE